MVFPIGRRIEAADGTFAGVAGAAGQVDYFQRFYRDAYPEAGVGIALLHRDATLLARHPPADSALGRKLPRVQERLAAAEGPGAEGGLPYVIGSASFVRSNTESSFVLSKIICSRVSPVKS